MSKRGKVQTYQGECISCHRSLTADEPPPSNVNGYFCDECMKPDWGMSCYVCGNPPVVPVTGLCGPCTWGEAETIHGNW